MRSEREMFELILGAAREDSRVLAVYMNGSRANPNVSRDEHQDYDIVFVVQETASFLADRLWVSIFGEIGMMQEPDANDCGWGLNHDDSRSYGWLILFNDGVRIDLRIQTVEETEETFGSDSLTVVLLDKASILPPLPPSSDSGYWIQKPEPTAYAGCCNEFWWCLNNVAKGIVRDQLPYVMRMYYETVHKELDHMLEWYIGMNHEYQITAGMWGKYFKKLLPEAFYQLYQSTFPDGTYENIWKAVFAACQLFHMAATEAGVTLHYVYCEEYERNMMRYLEKMKNQ